MPCYGSPPFPLIENDWNWLYQLLPIKYELKMEMACDYKQCEPVVKIIAHKRNVCKQR